jgi:hypothetical protein
VEFGHRLPPPFTSMRPVIRRSPYSPARRHARAIWTSRHAKPKAIFAENAVEHDDEGSAIDVKTWPNVCLH